MAQRLKRLPGMQKTQVRSLGWEDPLEKEMATPVLLPGESHGGRSLVGYSPWGRKESDTTERLHFYFSIVVFVFGLFMFSLTSWFSFRRLYLSKDLSISCKLSILLVNSCLWESVDPLCL